MQLFGPASPYLADAAAFRSAVSEPLQLNAELVDAWQGCSADKRTGCGPYFQRGDGPDFEVGFYDRGYHDRRTYNDSVRACADFVYREAVWVLTRARVC